MFVIHCINLFLYILVHKKYREARMAALGIKRIGSFFSPYLEATFSILMNPPSFATPWYVPLPTQISKKLSHSQASCSLVLIPYACPVCVSIHKKKTSGCNWPGSRCSGELGPQESQRGAANEKNNQLLPQKDVGKF